MIQELNVEILHTLYLTTLCCHLYCLAYTRFFADGLIDNFKTETNLCAIWNMKYGINSIML